MEDNFNIEYCSECDGHPVGFNTDIPLHGVSYKVVDDISEIDFENPNQLELKFGDEVRGSEFIEDSKTILVGTCNSCGTAHFKCVNCNTLNPIYSHEFKKEKDCKGGCGTIYFVDYSESSDSESIAYYYILSKEN